MALDNCRPRWCTVLPAAALGAVLATTGCGSSSDDLRSAPPLPAPEARDRVEAAPEPAYAHVSGHVSRASGEPYPAVWVEFKAFNGNVHTTTDVDGNYELPVPDGVYTALAGAHDDPGLSFDVVGRADNVVEVPGDTRVDFVARGE